MTADQFLNPMLKAAHQDGRFQLNVSGEELTVSTSAWPKTSKSDICGIFLLDLGSHVWTCLLPNFLFFVCLSHFCLDQFAVSHDLQDITEKQKQEHTAGSCQTKLDKKKRDNSVGQNGVGRCVCKLPMWRVGQESMLFTCQSIKMEKCLKDFQEEAFAVYQEDETIIRLTVWKAPAVWCEAADVKDVWPRRKKKSLFFFLIKIH